MAINPYLAAFVHTWRDEEEGYVILRNILALIGCCLMEPLKIHWCTASCTRIRRKDADKYGAQRTVLAARDRLARGEVN
jgi:hypothetical protein